MSNTEFSEEFIFIEEVHTRIEELNNYVKILCIVLQQHDEFYFLDDFVTLIFQKQQSLSDLIDESLAKPLFPALKQK